MLRLTALSAPLDFTPGSLPGLIGASLKLPPSAVRHVRIVRQSVDARDKGDVHFVLTVDFTAPGEDGIIKKSRGKVTPAPVPVPKKTPVQRFRRRPVVVGAGPAGLFAALTLARAGAAPILLERGRDVDSRRRDITVLQTENVLDPDSNVQFGEGGAGAFSDGKLTTGIKSPLIGEVLQTFVEHGAPEEILILQKPHIGTDLLTGVIRSIRQEIIALGGDVRFETALTGLILRGGQVDGVTCIHKGEKQEILTDTVLLCVGHSARDTLQSLFEQGVRMVQKPFAMGVRIEHPQDLINRSQWGRFAGHPALRAADYKLHTDTPDGRGVYTFCMCPGGEVICGASEPGHLAVNGMSYHARDGVNANSALLTGVQPEDFGSDHPLAGIALQRKLEQAAFLAGGSDYRAPVQRIEDFLAGRATTRLGDVAPTYRPGVTPADFREVLPDFIRENLRWGIRTLDRYLHGFALPDGLLTGTETRTSSPVRLSRDKGGEAEDIGGLFPTGEGAGYAGGIVSAAVDGIRAASSAMERSLGI